LSFPIYARPEAPGLILQLNRMGSLALALVVFLAGLGSVGLLHFLAASVRNRQREFGALRALGLIRTQVLGAVTWQAAAVSTIGVAIGVPTGIILGRMAWRAAVSRLGMIDEPAVSLWAVAAVGAAVALGTVVLAAGPGWIATRRTPATQLRSE
jgi:ABC-type antimicrobial peptide transport system permease subunit